MNLSPTNLGWLDSGFELAARWLSGELARNTRRGGFVSDITYADDAKKHTAAVSHVDHWKGGCHGNVDGLKARYIQ